MEIDETDEFQKDLKKMTKKYRTVGGDIDTFKELFNAHRNGEIQADVKRIPCGDSVEIPVFKARKFHCKSFPGGKIRVVYAYCPENENFLLLEIYPKKKRTNHNHEIILKYCQNPDWCPSGSREAPCKKQDHS